MNKGDVQIVSSFSQSPEDKSEFSSSKWHVIQLMDVVTKLSPMLQKRKIENFRSKYVRKETDLLTYSVETMGCQMNMADSERIEGQLRDMGYEKAPNSAGNMLQSTALPPHSNDLTLK